MISGLILTIGSFFFMFLLLVSYFSQNKENNIESRLYKYLLITMIFLLLSEFVSTPITYYSTDYQVKSIVTRIHWSSAIIWFYLLYFYSIAFISNPSVKTLKEYIFYNTRTKAITIFTIITSLIYLVIPFDSLEKVTYIPGPAAYFLLVYCAIIIICIIGYMIIHGKNISARKKRAIYAQAILLTIVIILQFIFKEIAFEAMGASIQMFYLYFNVENPDIKNAQELEGLSEEIEKSNKTKTEFLSNMSSEIVHPMNTIVKCSKLILKETNYNEIETKNYIKEISIAGGNLLNIIDNILDLSVLESTPEALDEKEYSITNVVKDLNNIVSTKIEEKPVEFILNIDEQIPSRLYGDYNKIYQVLLNFLTNSIKYTEVGKIKLSIYSQIIDKSCILTMKVSDTGIGIEKEKLDEINGNFAKNISPEDKANNYGLVIAKRYVDVMNGKVTAKSEYGVGSSFEFILKQKIVDSIPIGNIANIIKSSDDKVPIIDCSKYTILIVDDDELSVKVTKRILEPYNFNIKTLTSGRECIRNIKAENKYDMIFMDHMMHELDGIETLHKLKKLDGYILPPIVVLTANAISGMHEMYLNEGFDEYLAKPIKPSELNSLIKKYFAKKD